jgi:hypothetical protein
VQLYAKSCFAVTVRDARRKATSKTQVNRRKKFTTAAGKSTNRGACEGYFAANDEQKDSECQENMICHAAVKVVYWTKWFSLFRAGAVKSHRLLSTFLT